MNFMKNKILIEIENNRFYVHELSYIRIHQSTDETSEVIFSIKAKIYANEAKEIIKQVKNGFVIYITENKNKTTQIIKFIKEQVIRSSYADKNVSKNDITNTIDIWVKVKEEN